jgi:hypothetical protein
MAAQDSDKQPSLPLSEMRRDPLGKSKTAVILTVLRRSRPIRPLWTTTRIGPPGSLATRRQCPLRSGAGAGPADGSTFAYRPARSVVVRRAQQRPVRHALSRSRREQRSGCHQCRSPRKAVISSPTPAGFRESPRAAARLTMRVTLAFTAVGACWSRTPGPLLADPALLLLPARGSSPWSDHTAHSPDGGEIRWPPVGRNHGHQWGETMAAVGEKQMAIDICCRGQAQLCGRLSGSS